MSMETELQATIFPVCPRFFPDFAPPNTPAPYAIWQQVGGQPLAYGDDAIPDKRNGRIQITVWAANRAAANALMLQIEAAMIAQSHRPIGALLATYDEGAGLRGAIQDFSVWANR